MPAALTNRSIAPNCSTRDSAVDRTWRSSDTSHGCGIAPVSAATASNFGPGRSTAATAQSASLSRAVINLPIPLAAPVTTATLLAISRLLRRPRAAR